MGQKNNTEGTPAELTIEQALELVKSKESELATANDKIAALENDLAKKESELATANDKIATLEKDLAEKESELATAKDELAHTIAVNKDLTDKVEKMVVASGTAVLPEPKQATKEELEKLSFELDGKKYGFHFGKTNLGGKALTAAEICQLPDVQKELVSKKAGILKEL